MKKPEFTQEQKDWICWQIGEWYMKWKYKICNYQEKTHRLGFAKEELKSILCDELDEYIKNINILIGDE